MEMQIVNLLSEDQVKKVKNLIEKIDFQDGGISASGLAKDQKNNREAVREGENYKKLHNFILNLLIKNDWIKRRYLPRKFSSPLINKYSEDEFYGRHFDSAHMINDKVSTRNDYSFTLMLSKFEDYEGGELVIENGKRVDTVKLDAGDMVIYPSHHIHSVSPVTKGERTAYIGWFSSHIKDPLSLEVLNSYEDLHLSLLKYDLSDEDKLLLSFVQNKLEHILYD